MANGAGHTGHAWRRTRSIVLSPRPLVCYLCGNYIDHRIKDRTDPWAPQVHCVIPVSRGGSTTDLNNCKPVHRQCNLDQGNMMPWEGPFAQPRWVEGLDP